LRYKRYRRISSVFRITIFKLVKTISFVFSFVFLHDNFIKMFGRLGAVFTLHNQRFRDDGEILVLNDMPLAISRGLKMSVISGNANLSPNLFSTLG